MPMDINIWKVRLRQALLGIADYNSQRRGWLGIGPEASSPTETFCQFLNDLDIEDHLKKDDVDFNEIQKSTGNHLVALIRTKLPSEIRRKIKPEDLIDDPRMVEIRKAAKQFLDLLN